MRAPRQTRDRWGRRHCGRRGEADAVEGRAAELGLDVSGASIVELLHELHAQGTTIIVITHDNELAAQLPRQIAIRDGRIVGDSSQKEIVHDDVYAPA